MLAVTDRPARSFRRREWSLIGAAGGLAIILVLAKAASIELPWWPGWRTHLFLLPASSYRDVFFALACGAVGEILLLTLQKCPRFAPVLRLGLLALLAIFAGYAVAAVGLFRYFHRPVTYNLLTLVGNATTIRSSIVARVTWPIALALVAAPVLLFFFGWRSHLRRRGAILIVTIAAVWIGSGWIVTRSGWEREKLEYLALSPHGELLRTTAVQVIGGRRPIFNHDYPPAYVDEFRTFGARPAGSKSGPVLPEGTAPPRNVIIVVLESVGAKYLGLYGGSADVSPTLDRESQNALVFDGIYAHASFTYASFRPINFSVYPGLPWHYALLEDARPIPKTLASAFHARGFRTAYFTSGDLDWGDQRWLLAGRSGFDVLQGASDLGCGLLSSWGAEDRCAIERLVSWIEQKPDAPFFAVCWTDQTHDPFVPTPGAAPLDFSIVNKSSPLAADLSRYLNNVHQVDAQLARVFAVLRARGIADDTLVVITGDHGEAFADPHAQRGHAWSVYDEEVRVPLLFWNPRLFAGGRRSDTVGGHVDLNPTIADLAGIEPLGEWQGHSLFAADRPPRAFFMAIAGGDLFGVREGEWKYFYDVTSARESLFNLATDPQEQHNLAPSEYERCAELRRRVGAWVTFEDAYLWGREN